ncbi:MAG TPA: nucleotide disphospho-sugar-binding domain-containing protein [Polyangia bacterium]|nr:nucleotide disphospho-sugar-binding domain-containing protein [Polyangia bacterium]
MSQHKKTVAIFADGGFLAHVTRSYEVGRALARCFGHRVVFCGAGPYMHIPLDAGFEVRPVYTVDREMTMKLAKRAGLCSLSWWRNECERSVRSDLEVLGQIDPDLVVGDMHWSLCTSARVLEIPYVAITNAAWTRWYAEPIEPPAGHFSTKILGQRLCRKLFPKIKDALTWYYSLGYTEIRKRYGMAPVRSIFDLIEGDMTLLADVPEFMPTVDALPESFRYVGPILWDADLPEPAWLERLDPSRPTLYFTMGSTGDAQFFNEAIRVFGDTEYQILITTGGLADLGAVPRNVFVEQYAPGKALMRAADAVVSHGGNGTVYQALSCGVPLIGFPSIFDQEINMQRVCALGAGIRMWRSEYDAEALKEAVDHVLGDLTYRASCQRLERRIAYMDGPRRAALHIDHLLRSGSPAYQPDDVTNAIRLLPELDAA